MSHEQEFINKLAVTLMSMIKCDEYAAKIISLRGFATPLCELLASSTIRFLPLQCLFHELATLFTKFLDQSTLRLRLARACESSTAKS